MSFSSLFLKINVQKYRVKKVTVMRIFAALPSRQSILLLASSPTMCISRPLMLTALLYSINMQDAKTEQALPHRKDEMKPFESSPSFGVARVHAIIKDPAEPLKRQNGHN